MAGLSFHLLDHLKEKLQHHSEILEHVKIGGVKLTGSLICDCSCRNYHRSSKKSHSNSLGFAKTELGVCS
jgi:hypothetical protein